jgi:hypothetical protein
MRGPFAELPSCIRCGKAAASSGHPTCSACRAYFAAASAATYARRRERGSCKYCHAPPEPGRSMCRRHIALRASYDRKRAPKRAKGGRS